MISQNFRPGMPKPPYCRIALIYKKNYLAIVLDNDVVRVFYKRLEIYHTSKYWSINAPIKIELPYITINAVNGTRLYKNGVRIIKH